MRIDLYLFTKGLCKSRTEAARLIAEGAVYYREQPCRRPSFSVPDDEDTAAFRIDKSAHPYVSRGGEKLSAALSHFGLSPKGAICLDIGASTGGFTDCLLQNGAACVYAVDAGEGQMDPRLRSDKRVKVYENYNARFLSAEDFESRPSFAVMDVSFISATLIFPSLAALLPEGADFVCLVKPQFEVGREGLSKKGIVRDENLRRRALKDVCENALQYGFTLVGTMDSPILGGDGNKEYLAVFKRSYV